MHSAEASRKNMIDGQIKPNKVTDEALLEVLSRTPREKFVPRHLHSMAYADDDIPMGNGRYLPEPMVIARLIQEAAIKPSDVVLDIGCGTGYSTALMAQLATTVVGLESSKEMADLAERHLRDLDILNAAVINQADLTQGYAQQAPYQVILINGSVTEIPQALLPQLAEGGRLLTILTAADTISGHMGQALIITRKGDAYASRFVFDAAIPPLPGFAPHKKFEF